MRNRLEDAVNDLGWAPQPDEDELTGQLRGMLLKTMGTLGGDRGTQERAQELYEAHCAGTFVLDSSVLSALIAIVACTGDAARYQEFLGKFRNAGTPQDEQRYLYALACFSQPELITQTLERTISGEFRTQDAPFLIRAMLAAVHSREYAFEFIRAHWEVMKKQYPASTFKRMFEWIRGCATPELETSVRLFFTETELDFGGKVRLQYLESLRIAVAFGQRERMRLKMYLESY